MVFTLPIYYTKEYKTKPSKTMMVGMNQFMDQRWIRNEVKQAWQEDILTACKNIGPILGPYQVHYDLYYKNPSCDPSNIVALSEKIFLDAIQKAGLVKDDNVQHHKGSSYSVIDKDVDNPRVEITISAAS